ncbi:MAG: chaperone NapD [Gammaproteobacteria bacterium]|nr:chaperone NapD [Gammaproteobacteria bacterium]
MSAEIHISSLVVHGRPEGLESIETAIGGLTGAEVHGASSLGKLVVTLETVSEGEMLTRIDAINRIEGVLSVALIFHQVDDPTDPE